MAANSAARALFYAEQLGIPVHVPAVAVAPEPPSAAAPRIDLRA